MSKAPQLLNKAALFKVVDQPLTNNSLSDFRVIHTIKSTSPAFEKNRYSDDFLSYFFTRYIITYLTKTAKNKLMSASAKKMQEACWDVQLINEADLDNSIRYKTYKPVIKAVIGEETPIMRLHIRAAVIGAGILYSLRNKPNRNNIIEFILNNCEKEKESFWDIVLMFGLGISEEYGINEFTN